MRALGADPGWGFQQHQIKLVPIGIIDRCGEIQQDLQTRHEVERDGSFREAGNGVDRNAAGEELLPNLRPRSLGSLTVQEELIHAGVEVKDLKNPVTWVGGIQLEDVGFLIGRCNDHRQTEGCGTSQEIAADDCIASRAQEEFVDPISPHQAIATQAVRIEELIAAGAGLHRGAGSHENPIGNIRSLHPHVGELDPVAGDRGIGAGIQIDELTRRIHSHTESQIQLAPGRLPGDQRSSVGVAAERQGAVR